MKPTFDSNRKMLAHGFAAILLACAFSIPVASANNDGIVQSSGGVPHVSGGVGKDSIERLNALARDFNLKLVFALKSGNYVSDVKVTITDTAGKTLVDTISAGPWLMTKLPTGSYQIGATFAGQTIKRQVSISSATLRTIDLRWAGE